jgi:predicted PurR-regulated permease PerM
MIAMLALLAGELIWGIPGLILALPLTAILKVIFDHVPALHAYGFLLGEAPKRSKRE